MPTGILEQSARRAPLAMKFNKTVQHASFETRALTQASTTATPKRRAPLIITAGLLRANVSKVSSVTDLGVHLGLAVS